MARQFWTPRSWIILGGLAFGVLASLLTKWGNPANMGICIACFYRDITGGLGLHRASVVQYLRPEIMGFIIGAFISSYAFREFRPRGGSSPIIRFLLGAFFMIGALAFLGCPIRALIRLAGGDLNGILALAGVVLGVFIGIRLLRSGYNLGRAGSVSTPSAWMMPLFIVALLLLIIFKPHFLFFSQKGPGSMHAPLILSLLVGFLSVSQPRRQGCVLWEAGETSCWSGIFTFSTGLPPSSSGQ